MASAEKAGCIKALDFNRLNDLRLLALVSKFRAPSTWDDQVLSTANSAKELFVFEHGALSTWHLNEAFIAIVGSFYVSTANSSVSAMSNVKLNFYVDQKKQSGTSWSSICSDSLTLSTIPAYPTHSDTPFWLPVSGSTYGGGSESDPYLVRLRVSSSVANVRIADANNHSVGIHLVGFTQRY